MPRPQKQTRYPLYRRRGGPWGRSGRVYKISPPPIFVLPTVRPATIRYTEKCSFSVHIKKSFSCEVYKQKDVLHCELNFFSTYLTGSLDVLKTQNQRPCKIQQNVQSVLQTLMSRGGNRVAQLPATSRDVTVATTQQRQLLASGDGLLELIVGKACSDGPDRSVNISQGREKSNFCLV